MREEGRQKDTETVFFPSHSPTDNIPLQEALWSVSTVVNRMLKAPSQGSFIILLIIQRLRKNVLIQHSRSESSVLILPLLLSTLHLFKAAQYPSSAETGNLMHTNADSDSF